MKLTPKFNLSLCAAVTLLVSPAALCADFHSPKGYSMKYPSSWKMLTKTQAATAKVLAKADYGSMVDSDMDVMFIDPASPGVFLGVIVLPRSIPVGNEFVAKWGRSFKRGLDSAHINSDHFDCTLMHLGSHDVACAAGHIECVRPVKHNFQMREYVLSSAGTTYFVTCIAPPNNSFSRVFDKVVSSFKAG